MLLQHRVKPLNCHQLLRCGFTFVHQAHCLSFGTSSASMEKVLRIQHVGHLRGITRDLALQTVVDAHFYQRFFLFLAAVPEVAGEEDPALVVPAGLGLQEQVQVLRERRVHRAHRKLRLVQPSLHQLERHLPLAVLDAVARLLVQQHARIGVVDVVPEGGAAALLVGVQGAKLHRQVVVLQRLQLLHQLEEQLVQREQHVRVVA
mmetsp:Transcript_30066/g.50556  ORF Transcript_30066/g.50556 Transcript_30066/m.50556 type:complete len:204 (+) Transcript_30066:460-1071(+)